MRIRRLNEAKINTDKLIVDLDKLFKNVMSECRFFYLNNGNTFNRETTNDFVDFHRIELARVEACSLIRNFIQIYIETGSVKPLYALANFSSSNLMDHIDFDVLIQGKRILKDFLKFKPEKYYDPDVDSGDYFKWIEVK